jgi:hypothetical protein
MQGDAIPGSRNKLDAMHFMQRIAVPLLHPLCNDFKAAQRDAIFLKDEMDVAAVESIEREKWIESGNDPTSFSFYKLYNSHPDKYQRLIRRVIPPPHLLVPRLQEVYRIYGNLQGPDGAPLFSKTNWDEAEEALHHARKGCLSDPPGIQLYFPLGLNSDGLQMWSCCRGTSAVESIHQKLKMDFKSWNAGPQVKRIICSCLLISLTLKFNQICLS